MKALSIPVILFVCVIASAWATSRGTASAESAPAAEQTKKPDTTAVIKPRYRVIIDNDFGGDPDGLFQLAQHLLSPSVEVRGVIGTRNHPWGFYNTPGSSAYSCEQARRLFELLEKQDDIKLVGGAEHALGQDRKPINSEGARLIIEEAMREDTNLPLYVVCGASLTEIASAYLMEPKIAGRLRLIWIGGPEHEGTAPPPPGGSTPEYNLSIDLVAGQVVFNDSNLELWQVPRNAYRQTLVSHAELHHRLGDGPLGHYLIDRLEDLMKRADRSLGEAYALGDSPLVLLTALQSSWEVDPSSSEYIRLNAPTINAKGLYETNPNGRPIRVYTRIDNRQMFEDLYAKVQGFDHGQ